MFLTEDTRTAPGSLKHFRENPLGAIVRAFRSTRRILNPPVRTLRDPAVRSTKGYFVNLGGGAKLMRPLWLFY